MTKFGGEKLVFHGYYEVLHITVVELSRRKSNIFKDITAKLRVKGKHGYPGLCNATFISASIHACVIYCSLVESEGIVPKVSS